MQKSILIIGAPGSGKTTKLNSLFNKLDPSVCAQMSFRSFIDSNKYKLKERFDTLVFDEIHTASQIYCLLDSGKKHDFKLIIATQLSKDDLEVFNLTPFDIIEL